MSNSETQNTTLPAVLAAAGVGAVIALQSVINGYLNSHGAGPIFAGWVAYIGALVTIVVYLAVRNQFPQVISTLRQRGKWWWFTFGIPGIPLVLAMTGAVPLVGAAVASVCSIAGQTVGGLIFDAKGIGRQYPLPMTTLRLLAVVVAVIGLAIALLGGTSAHPSPLVIVGIGMALFAFGVVICIQQAGTGYMAEMAGASTVSAFTALAGSTAVFSIGTAIWAVSGGATQITLPGASHWFLYAGGPLGAIAVTLSAWAVQKLGVFTMTLSLVGGQMLASILLDTYLTGTFSVISVIAALVICGAVVLAIPRKDKQTAR